jgi:hypothetical protein
MTVNREGAGVTSRQIQIEHLPLRSSFGVAMIAQQRRRFVGPERHIKLIERMRQSTSDRFNVSLLPRPAPKKRRRLFCTRQRPQNLNLKF